MRPIAPLLAPVLLLLLLPWAAAGLELRATSDVTLVDAGLFLFAISDGGTGDLDGTVNDEIVFDMNDPATSALYTGALFAPLAEFSGLLTLAPEEVGFASVMHPATEPILTLADFRMETLPGESATMAIRFDGEALLTSNSGIGGAVEGRFDPLLGPSSVHFLGITSSELGVLWDGTLAGMPVSITKSPPDDPAFAAAHYPSLPAIGPGPVDFTGVLQVDLAPGAGVDVPEPAVPGALLPGLLLLGARRLRPRQLASPSPGASPRSSTGLQSRPEAMWRSVA